MKIANSLQHFCHEILVLNMYREGTSEKGEKGMSIVKSNQCMYLFNFKVFVVAWYNNILSSWGKCFSKVLKQFRSQKHFGHNNCNKIWNQLSPLKPLILNSDFFCLSLYVLFLRESLFCFPDKLQLSTFPKLKELNFWKFRLAWASLLFWSQKNIWNYYYGRNSQETRFLEFKYYAEK